MQPTHCNRSSDIAAFLVRNVAGVVALQDGRLAGIVSLRDLLAADVDEKAEELTLLNAYVHYIPANMQVRTDP